MSFVFISHLLGEILGCSDRIVVMRDGRSLPRTAPAAFDRDKLVVAMGGAGGRRRYGPGRRRRKMRPLFRCGHGRPAANPAPS